MGCVVSKPSKVGVETKATANKTPSSKNKETLIEESKFSKSQDTQEERSPATAAPESPVTHNGLETPNARISSSVATDAATGGTPVTSVSAAPAVHGAGIAGTATAAGTAGTAPATAGTAGTHPLGVSSALTTSAYVGSAIDPGMFITKQKGTLTDRYAREKKLGSGACGEVLLCRDKSTGAERAVKVIKKKTVSQADSASLLDEVAVVKSLDHPN
eukprot:Lankesteria_metandrocarpae@DN9320_c0_g1_i1.p1